MRVLWGWHVPNAKLLDYLCDRHVRLQDVSLSRDQFALMLSHQELVRDGCSVIIQGQLGNSPTTTLFSKHYA